MRLEADMELTPARLRTSLPPLRPTWPLGQLVRIGRHGIGVASTGFASDAWKITVSPPR
jgi:hypothetical protein